MLTNLLMILKKSFFHNDCSDFLLLPIYVFLFQYFQRNKRNSISTVRCMIILRYVNAVLVVNRNLFIFLIRKELKKTVSSSAQ